jgi:hypothetical protein
VSSEGGILPPFVAAWLYGSNENVLLRAAVIGLCEPSGKYPADGYKGSGRRKINE